MNEDMRDLTFTVFIVAVTIAAVYVEFRLIRLILNQEESIPISKCYKEKKELIRTMTRHRRTEQ